MKKNQETENVAKSAISDTVKKVVKEVAGEGVEVVASGLVAGGLMSLFRNIFSKAAPKVQEHIEKKAEEITKGDIRKRTDEGIFFMSLVMLENVSAHNKDLFEQKHYELRHPNFSGKSPEEIGEMKLHKKLAKGIIFLINEVVNANEPNLKKKFEPANKLWHGIFRDIETFPDDTSKLKVLEQRILNYGENNQENITLSEIVETFSMWSDEHIRPKPEDEYKGPITQIGKSFRKLLGR